MLKIKYNTFSIKNISILYKIITTHRNKKIKCVLIK